MPLEKTTELQDEIHATDPLMFSVEGLRLSELKKLQEHRVQEFHSAETELDTLLKVDTDLIEKQNDKIRAYHATEKTFDGSAEALKDMEKAKDELTEIEAKIAVNHNEINRVKALLMEITKEKQILSARINELEQMKDEVVLEYTYVLPKNKKIKYKAQLIQTQNGYEVEYNGKRVPVTLNAGSPTISEIKKEYKYKKTPSLSELSYVLLYLNVKQKNPNESVILFEDEGTQGLARYETHNDGPDGPIPTDHPGIGIYVKKS